MSFLVICSAFSEKTKTIKLADKLTLLLQWKCNVRVSIAQNTWASLIIHNHRSGKFECERALNSVCIWTFTMKYAHIRDLLKQKS